MWGLILFLLLILLALRLDRACRKANRVDWGIGWMNWVDGLNRLFCYGYHRLNVMSLRLPKTGAAIVVSNHVSGLDPLLLIASARRPLHFLILREEYERFGLNWLFKAVGCIPVDRTGKPHLAFKVALDVLKKGGVVALFPHGFIHLDSDKFKKIKGGAVRLSHLAGVNIYPHRLSGIHGSSSGSVFAGVVLPAKARLVALKSLSPSELDRAEMGKVLQALLDGEVS